MLVLDRVTDDDDLALAVGEMVEVGARIELDLVADHRWRVPWPAGAEAAVTVSTAPSSTSVSLARTSTRIVSFSPVVAVSGLATGPSLVPVTVIVTVEDGRRRHARPAIV